MKAKHRHELKTNELAEWIANFPQWVKKNAKTIAYTTACLAVLIAAYFYYDYNKNIAAPKKMFEFTGTIAELPKSKTKVLQTQAQGQDYSIKLLQLADELQIRAIDAQTDTAAALALIKRGQTLRMDLHYRTHSASEDEIVIQVNKAKASYNEALPKAKGNPSLTAMAKLGLGLCEEELGNFQNAEKIYTEIAGDPSLDATTAKTQAQLRLKTMSDYLQKVAFKAPPEPTIELIEPDIQLDTLDINIPVFE